MLNETDKEMSYTVKDIFGHKNKRGDIGIELECEGKRSLPDVNTSPWTTKAEGSLRHIGKEYITTNPIKVNEDLLPTIKHLTDQINEPIHQAIPDSPRTSVHVHTNVLGLTPTQVWTVATCYWLLENPLMEFCGPTRIGNRFCLRLKDAEGVLKFALKDIKSGGVPFAAMANDHVRYSGLNLAAVSKFGSVEFRGMRGTLDPNIIALWSTNCHSMINNVIKHFKSPAEAMDYYFKSGPDAFIRVVLEGALADHMKYSIRGWREDMEESSGMLCELAYLHSWDKWADKIKNAGLKAKPKVEESELDRRVRQVRDAVSAASPSRYRVITNGDTPTIFWAGADTGIPAGPVTTVQAGVNVGTTTVPTTTLSVEELHRRRRRQREQERNTATIYANDRAVQGTAVWYEHYQWKLSSLRAARTNDVA